MHVTPVSANEAATGVLCTAPLDLVGIATHIYGRLRVTVPDPPHQLFKAYMTTYIEKCRYIFLEVLIIEENIAL